MRWVCPTCSSGVNAPQRMNALDSRRFCLSCSAKEPRLVARVCPVLDKSREERLAKRKAATLEETRRLREGREKKATIDEQKRTIGGYDLMEEAARYWKILKRSPWLPPAHRAVVENLPLPTIKFRRRQSGFKGLAYTGQQLITISMAPEVDTAEALELVLHELVHCVCPLKENHGTMFRRVLRDAAAELWGTDVPVLPVHRYGLDDLLREQLREKLGLPPRKRYWIKGGPDPKEPVRVNVKIDGDLAKVTLQLPIDLRDEESGLTAA